MTTQSHSTNAFNPIRNSIQTFDDVEYDINYMPVVASKTQREFKGNLYRPYSL